MSQSPSANSLIGGAIANNFFMPVLSWQSSAAPQHDFQQLLDVALQSAPPSQPAKTDGDGAARKDDIAAKGNEKPQDDSDEGEPKPQATSLDQQGELLNLLSLVAPATPPVTTTPLIPTADNMPFLLASAAANSGQAGIMQQLLPNQQKVAQIPLLQEAGMSDLLADEGGSALSATNTLASQAAIEAAAMAVKTPLTNVTKLSPVEQLQQTTLPWRPVVPEVASPVEQPVNERVTVVALGENGGQPGQPLAHHPLPGLEGGKEQLLPATPDLTPQAKIASQPAAELSFATLTNGFSNGFTNAAGISAAGGLSLNTQGGVVSSPTNGVNAARPLTATVTDFPDVVAAELGRSRIVNRPNQAEQIRIQLDPQDLGELDLHVKVGVDRQVHMLITTESEHTKELLQKQMGELREALAGQNLSFGDVRVEVDARGHSGEAWRNAHQQDNPKGFTSNGETGKDTNVSAPPPRRSSIWLPGGGISIQA